MTTVYPDTVEELAPGVTFYTESGDLYIRTDAETSVWLIRRIGCVRLADGELCEYESNTAVCAREFDVVEVLND